jgi:spore germination protein KC
MKMQSPFTMKIKIFLVIIMLILTTGCYDSIEVDDMVYVVSMGIDQGSNGNLRISLLFAVPISVGVGPEPGEIEKATTMVTVEALTIYGGVNVINAMVGKQVNFSHAKLIIISKKLAEKGVEKFINTFNKFREFRSDTFIGISRCDAEEFLRETKPILEVNPAKYFELLFNTYKITGFTVGSRLEDFYIRMECTCNEPVAVLLDVSNIESSDDIKLLSITNKKAQKKEGNLVAGEIPVVFDNKAHGMGLAVFKTDKMVGEITGRETVYFLIVSNMLDQVYYSVPDEEDNGDSENGNYISLRLKQERKTSIKVKMEDDVPIINVRVLLEADILSSDSDKDYSKGKALHELEDYISEYINNDIKSFLEKTRSDFKSDICATGKEMKKKFMIWDDWIQFDWTKKYEKAEFNVSTKVSIRRTGMTIRQIPIANQKGE